MSKAIKGLKQTLLIGAVLLALSYLSYWAINNFVEDRLNPFAPLSIADQPSFATKLKIAGLKVRPKACLQVLQESDLEYQLLPDRETAEGCGFYNAARLIKSGISYGGDITLSCAALVGLAVWEKHDLQPLAQELFDQEVVRIRHYGTYSCRNIANRKVGKRSQHAKANAIDIAGFRLADGREISIAKDWQKESKAGQFLRQLHAAACDRFSTVLGPEYNQQHQDHFHFDQSSYGICR